MGVRYPPEAIETCRKFYIEFGGNGKEIEKAMKSIYPSWSRNNLDDRADRLGWVSKHGFEKSLELHQQNLITNIQSVDERRYQAVIALADVYQAKALRGESDAVGTFIKLTDQQIALRTKLDLEASTLETFTEAFEQIAVWAKDIDPALAKLFYKRKEEFIDRALAKYGSSGETN